VKRLKNYRSGGIAFSACRASPDEPDKRFLEAVRKLLQYDTEMLSCNLLSVRRKRRATVPITVPES